MGDVHFGKKRARHVKHHQLNTSASNCVANEVGSIWIRSRIVKKRTITDRLILSTQNKSKVVNIIASAKP